MKKTVLTLAVLMFAVPAFAGICVECTIDGNEVTVSYEMADDANRPRAFGLDISVKGANIVGGPNNFHPEFYIYPTTIDVNDDHVDPNGWGTPICAQDSNSATMEMGSLWAPDDPDHNEAPDPNGDLFTFIVDKPGDANVTLGPNAQRGGVVMADISATFPEGYVTFQGCAGEITCTVPNIIDFSEADASSAIVAAGLTVGTITYWNGWSDTIAEPNVLSSDPNGGTEVGCDSVVNFEKSLGPECMPSDHADYTKWTKSGKPPCWCFKRICHGDADGAREGPIGNKYWVGNADLTILKNGWLEKRSDTMGVDACADFDRALEGPIGDKYAIGNADLTILKNNWLGSPASDCSPGNRIPPP